MVQVPRRKTSLFRRFSADLSKLTVKPTRSTGNMSDAESSSTEVSPILQNRRKSIDPPRKRMEVISDDKIIRDTDKTEPPNIPGLRGRDVVAIAILVDDQGVPMKTYTEHQDIPSDEYDAAKQVYISRVPCADPVPKRRESTTSHRLNVKPLSTVLSEDLDTEKAKKLSKRMSKVLNKLHTTDLDTALALLKVERFLRVRKEIKEELLIFAEKDLKMIYIA